MGRLTPDEFRAKYATLPQNLREAYGSLDTTKILQEIGRKHGLLIDQIGELVNETGFLMLGATRPSDYISKLASALAVGREQAKEIAVDVNEQVFKPIRDALKQVHKVGEYARAGGSGPKQLAPAEVPRAEPAPSRGTAPTPQKEKEEAPRVRTLADDVRQAANIPLSPPKNLSEERLTKTFSLPHKEKSYTLSETGEEETAPTHQYQMDPYREPVE